VGGSVEELGGEGAGKPDHTPAMKMFTRLPLLPARFPRATFIAAELFPPHLTRCVATTTQFPPLPPRMFSQAACALFCRNLPIVRGHTFAKLTICL